MSIVFTTNVNNEYPILNNIHKYLTQYNTRAYDDTSTQLIGDQLISLKRNAVADDNQRLAKVIWCLERILRAQSLFWKVYQQMQEQLFYAAWTNLERVEVNIRMLDRHFQDDEEQYGLSFMRKYVPMFQSLYPYAMFCSPEILKKKVVCSICDALVTLRNTCGHRKHEIYDGEHCYHIITESELLAIAMTENPVQKYSVVWTGDPATSGGDPNKQAYPLADYVSRGLSSPWDEWQVNNTTVLHPHEHFSDVSLEEECPCTDPIGRYVDCCYSKEGVTRPHKVVTFYRLPIQELPTRIYL